MIQLLSGSLDEHGMYAKAAEHDVLLRENTLVIAFYKRDDIMSLLPALKRLIAETESIGKASAYLVKGVQQEAFSITLTYDKEEELKPFFYQLYRMDPDVCIGIGSMEKQSNIARSYALSLSALEAAMYDDGSNVVGYDDLEVCTSNSLKPILDYLERAEVAAIRRDADRVYEAISTVISLTNNGSNSSYVQKIAFITTYNLLTRLLNGLGEENPYLYAMTDASGSAKERADILGNLCDRLISCFYRQPEEDADIRQILQYIQENYENPSLSLSLIAGDFHMSYSNFSHFFKKKTGDNFTSFLEKMRMDKAKEMLKQSGLSIEIIAEAVGYSNANSFSRAFKKQELTSPGEYRRQTNEKVHKR